MTKPTPPTQEQLESALKIREDIIAISRAIDALGYKHADPYPTHLSN